MPASETNLKAVQIVTQRVTVEPESKRSHAEPIGRDFADLVAAARAGEESATKTPKETDAEGTESLLVSNLVEEDDTATPGTFLVANATLAEASPPVVGVVRHPEDQLRAAAIPTAAPTDILLDTESLFLPPDPNRPIETAAVATPTEFDSLSWPPPESANALQAAIANAGVQQPKVLVSAGTPTDNPEITVVADTPEGVEGGPGASRQAARLHAATTLGEGAATQASSSAQTPNAQGQPAATPAQTNTAQAGSTPQAQPLPAETVQPTAQQAASTTGAQPAAQLSPTQAAQAPATPSNVPPPALANAPSATVQVYNRIIERFDGRAQQYQLRLDPPELGKVNVRIEIGSDNRVHAILSTHDSNALSDLLRGQRALEQSLTSAGLDLAEDGIKFELSDQGAHQSARQDETPTPRRSATGGDQLAAADGAAEPAPPSWARTRINIVA